MHRTVYQIGVTVESDSARVWIDRNDHVHHMYHTTLSRADQVRSALPKGGIFDPFADGGWNWVLPNFGRKGPLT